MSSKTYAQYCGVAAALDQVGDRWTLLILRELTFGERRFTDLRAGLPGIASNLLTERLRDLERAGLVEQRELPAPAARTVYALTSEGREIRPVLRALFRFGMRFLDEPQEGGVRPEMAVYGGLPALLDEKRAADVDLTARFVLDDTELALRVHDGRVARPRPDAAVDVTVRGSAAALVQLCRGTATLPELSDRLVLEGTAAARRTFLQVFGLG